MPFIPPPSIPFLCSYPHNPKYSHSAALHQVLQTYAKYILGSAVPNATIVNADVDVMVYGSLTAGVAFVSNISPVREYNVSFGGREWTLPAWSVTIVDTATGIEVYCTAVIMAPAPQPTLPPTRGPQVHTMAVMGVNGVEVEEAAPQKARAVAENISYIREHIGISLSTVNKSTTPLEQFSLTQDATDFLWYTTSYTLTQADVDAGYLNLTLTNVNEFVYVYFNSQLAIEGFASNIGSRPTRFAIPVKGLAVGTAYALQLLVVTMGLQNCCGGLEAFTRGLEGRVTLGGKDLTSNGWIHQVGLQGEAGGYVTGKGPWLAGSSPLTPLTWYKMSVISPTPATSPLPSWQLDLVGMGKGLLWFNGHPMGRYYDIIAQGTCPEVCDYRGAYSDGKCRYGCGEPSLRLYHIPRSWLKAVGEANEIIVLEERAGDP